MRELARRLDQRTGVDRGQRPPAPAPVFGAAVARPAVQARSALPARRPRAHPVRLARLTQRSSNEVYGRTHSSTWEVASGATATQYSAPKADVDPICVPERVRPITSVREETHCVSIESFRLQPVEDRCWCRLAGACCLRQRRATCRRLNLLAAREI